MTPAASGLSVEEILITPELARRPVRARDPYAETRALAGLARELASNPRTVLHKLAELVQSLCHADSAGISILEPGATEGALRWHAAAGPFAKYLGGTMPRADSPCGVAIERNSVLLFEHAGQVFPRLPGCPCIHENLVAPWSVGGATVGTVWAVTHDPEHHFDTDDARLLETLGAFAAAAWQTVGALDQAERAAAAPQATEARLGQELDAMHRLYELHARLATESELGVALDLILRTACEFTHTDRGCIQLLGEDGERLEIVSEQGFGPDSPFIRHFRHHGAAQGCEAARVQRQRILIEDSRDFPGLAGTADGAAALAEGILAAQSTPMISRKGETMGVLSTQFRAPHRPSDEELRLVDLLAWTAADFVEHHQAQAKLRRAEQRRAFLLELSDALRPLADGAAIEAKATAMLGRYLGAGRVLIGEFHGDEVVIGRDFTQGVVSLTGHHPGSAFGSILIQACARGEALAIDDVGADPRVDDSMRARWTRNGIGALLAVGLFAGTRIAATLAVHFPAPRRWSEADIQLVRETAERAWPAIERARAEAALKEADQRKDDFLATLAHELRNPLAPISNAVHLMRRPDGRRVTDRLMGIVERQVQQIVRLVDDLLEISRITRGKIQLDRHPVRLADAVRDAVETSRPLVERARHQLTVALPEEPLTVYADGVRLTQVLSNLVNNAAKYTGSGGRIWLSADHEGDDVAIRVRDNGFGITDAQLPHVFEMFAQGHTPGETTGDGLGIGLAIVRKLVEMHGGTVEAHSAGPQQGSEFVVRLPLLDSHGDHWNEPALWASTVPCRTLSGQRILVVDDNRDAADTLALLLETHGAATRVAYDGETALAALAESLPDAMLLDLGMPGMDGFAVARHARADPRFAGLRILALTGWGQAADRERTRAAGFDHHLTKPVDFAALEAWLTAGAASAALPGALT
jgi:signal transduction histidine kinase/ActR/RegA family two-component response regulator/transcriptional regulator with GAF, ATPase, and Fis domain